MSVELVMFGILILFVVGIVALGIWHPRTGAEVLDWKPTRSYEDEVRLELEDIDQMLEAQNERRRRSGRAEVTEDHVRSEVEAEERELRERAERYAGEKRAGSPRPPADPAPETPPEI